MQATEAGLNNVVFIGAALVFVVTFETRLKRAHPSLAERAALDRTRDRHASADQGSADPRREAGCDTLIASAQSVRVRGRALSRLLQRDAVADRQGRGVYAQASSDPEVVSAVNELEQLTHGLAAKIWNKFAAIHAAHPID
jgi:hypothetical protein